MFPPNPECMEINISVYYFNFNYNLVLGSVEEYVAREI